MAFHFRRSLKTPSGQPTVPASHLGLTVVALVFCCGLGTVISAIGCSKPKAAGIAALGSSTSPKPIVNPKESPAASLQPDAPNSTEAKPHYQPRTWSDSQGKFKVEATLLGVQGDQVTITRTDNKKEIKVALEKLSSADQLYVRYATEPKVDPNAEILIGPVSRIPEGDTLQVNDLQQGMKTVRLAGVKAPRSKEPAGSQSRKHLASTVSGKQVRVEIVGNDEQGLLIGNVYVDGNSLSENLVANGLVEVQSENTDGKLIELQQQAQSSQLGLWASQPTSPNAPEETKEESPAAPSSDQEVIVYVTATGGKYHTEECQHLGKSKRAISLTEAKGTYSPCSRCNPPQ